MTGRRLRLPHWTAHPGFGVAALFALAVTLIIHGEPQPSARDNGRSVVVSGAPLAPPDLPPTLVIYKDTLEYRQRSSVRHVALPRGEIPTQVLTSRGLSIVLAVALGRQRAYAVSKSLAVTDLGYADAMLPAVAGRAAVLIESALASPGLVSRPSPAATETSSRSTATSPAESGPPALRDFGIRRYDASGHALGPISALPAEMRAAADTAVGLTVWQPVNRIFDGAVALESTSAAAVLIRPDGSLRRLGPVHPLAASSRDLLVWDVERRQFAAMPLRYVTANSTRTVGPSASGSTTANPSPQPTPSTVAGTRYFNPTRGFVVTGPASFSPDGSAVAIYAQVGNRRRLVVTDVGTEVPANQIEVLALATPAVKPSPAVTGSSSTGVSGRSTTGPSGRSTSGSSGGSTSGSSGGSTSGSAAPGSSSTSPSAGASTTLSTTASTAASTEAFEPDGFPIPAPLTPVWWNGEVIGVGSEAAVVGYRPGSGQASLLDLGISGIQSLALGP